jgi:hypothetical protein
MNDPVEVVAAVLHEDREPGTVEDMCWQCMTDASNIVAALRRNPHAVLALLARDTRKGPRLLETWSTNTTTTWP